jgi:hypothetical protein
MFLNILYIVVPMVLYKQPLINMKFSIIVFSRQNWTVHKSGHTEKRARLWNAQRTIK